MSQTITPQATAAIAVSNISVLMSAPHDDLALALSATHGIRL
jgi:hypothetical protein